jgi:hypothetical protein
MITHLVSSNVCEAFGDGQQFPQYRLISLDRQPHMGRWNSSP